MHNSTIQQANNSVSQCDNNMEKIASKYWVLCWRPQDNHQYFHTSVLNVKRRRWRRQRQQQQQHQLRQSSNSSNLKIAYIHNKFVLHYNSTTMPSTAAVVQLTLHRHMTNYKRPKGEHWAETEISMKCSREIDDPNWKTLDK